VDDFIVTTLDELANNQNLTLCYWLNYNDAATANWPYRYPLFKGIAGESNDFASRINPSNQSEFVLYNSGSGFPIQSVFSIQQNDWINIVNVCGNGTSTIYINGAIAAQQSAPYSPNITNYPLYIGNGHTLGYYSGLLDDITIYNRALSPEEVTQLYAVQSTGDPTAGGGGNTTGPLANVPRGISYQAVARDAQGQAIASSPVNVRFTLHQGTPTGTTEYSETHALATSEIGLFSTYFGSGTAVTSAFDSIVWSNTTKFLQVEIDLGNGYVDMGTQQLMSVPYAYRANEAAAAGTIRNNALPIYPDNAAALAGGLVAGEMYRTATGDLKIVY